MNENSPHKIGHENKNFLRNSSILDFMVVFLLLEDYIIEREKRNHAEERFPKDLDIALS